MKTIECLNIVREEGRAILSLDGAEYAVDMQDLGKVLTDLAGQAATPGKELLRPSMLPKLAECPCFVSSPDAGEAAARGTRMDTAFRNLILGVKEFKALEHLKQDEKESVLWAVERVRMICASETLVVDKKRCTFTQWHPRVTGGEADGICPSLAILFDLKSGQIRNYWEQQASYAKSVMEREFLHELTCHLLFCDQREVVTRVFTYDEAIAIVNGVVDSVDRGDGPRLCDYCGWCAAQDICPVRNKAAHAALALATSENLEESFAAISASPERLAEFLINADVLESYAKRGKSILLEYNVAGKATPGFKRVSSKGNDTVEAGDVAKYANTIGARKIITAYGSMSASAFRALWAEAFPDKSFPESVIKTGSGFSYLKKTSSKKSTINK